MAFLTLNGLRIPVEADSVTREEILIGEQERAFSGNLLSDRRAYKRRWTLNTCPLTCEQALVIRDIIRAENWEAITWEGGLDTLIGSASPSTGTASRTPTAGADGSLVTGEALTGDESLAVSRSTTGGNLLSSDSANAENAPTGYSATNVTLASDTTNYFQGSRSVEITGGTLSSNRYLSTQTTAAVPDGDAIGSVWLYSDRQQTVDVSLYDTLATAEGPKTTAVLKPGFWQRVYCHFDSANNATFQLRVYQGSTIENMKVSADAFSITRATGGHAIWADSGLDPSSTNLQYTPTDLIGSAGDLTIAGWIRLVGPQDSALSLSGDVFRMVGPSELFKLSINTSGVFFIQSQGGAGTLESVITTQTAPSLDWAHIAVVFREEPSGSQTSASFYLDGALVWSDNFQLPDFSTLTSISLGNNAGSNLFPGHLNDFVFWRRALSSTAVGWLAASTSALTAPPKLDAGGDVLCNEDATVIGSIQEETIFGAFLEGSWQTDARRLRIDLEEA